MLKSILKSRFGKSVIMIMGGTTFAQALNVIVSPFITRIYSPEEYGILTAYTAILGILAFATLNYEFAIPIEKKEQKSINILVLSLIILIINVIVLLIIFLFFSHIFLRIFNSEILYDYRFVIPLGVFLIGLYSIFNKWAFRDKDFKSISKTIINQSIFSNFVKIILGLLGLGPLGLIVGKIIGDSAGIRVLSKPIVKRYKTFKGMISLQEIISCLKRYRDFPFYNAPSSLLMALGGSLPIIFLTSMYGSTVVGFYGLAYSIVKLPMNLLGQAVSDVFFAEVASIGNKNPAKIKDISKKLLKKLILVGLIPLIVLMFLGPQLFSLVFGQDWYESGQYARIISIMIFLMLVLAPSGKVYIVFEKQKVRLLIDILRVALILIAFAVSYIFKFDSYVAVTMHTIAMSISYIFMHIISKNILENEIKKNLTVSSNE